MQYGFVKVAAATPKIRVADCHYNAEQVFTLMRDAEKQGVKLLCFPELCLTGYTCGDLFLHRTLLQAAEEALGTVLYATRNLELVAAVGLPVQVNGKLYNCAAVMQGGCLLGVIPKQHLPNYSEFYEQRWFTPYSSGNGAPTQVTLCGQTVDFGTDLLFRCADYQQELEDGTLVPQSAPIPELVLGVEICEDLWVPVSPSAALTAAGATVIMNLSASDEIVCKDSYRRSLVANTSGRLVCGYILADAGEGESTTDLIFGAHNLIAENGGVLAESRFQTGLTISELDIQKLMEERQRMNTYPAAGGAMREIPFYLSMRETVLTRYIPANPFVPADHEDRDSRCEEILLLASLGLKKRLEHTRAAKVVIGLSGGLDSTLAILITKIAMDMLGRPASDILAVTMPCFGTTERTKDNACRLADSLGAELRKIDIGKAVQQHFKDIGQSMEDHSVTFENAQARERTQVLMDLANQTGGLVVGTGDLSELALGWATYNGDHMSMYAVNASIPKTLVRHVVRFVAEDKAHKDPDLAEVLYDILNTPVSPELLPPENGTISQRTEELVGPYELHDFFLYQAVRCACSPAKVFHLAEYALSDRYDRSEILKWLKVFYRRFFGQQFKRSCLPDGPKVGSVTLSPRGDWRMPSDAVVSLWQEELDGLTRRLPEG